MGELPIAEQAKLTSGADFWTTKAVEPAGAEPVGSITLTDGPHGVRRQRGATDHLGINAAEPATCFPPAVALAQTWDPELIARVAGAIGTEAHALDVQVVLGPGVNIKRDPRGGRNFEYYSEDPHLAGVLGSAWVSGIQARGVGASVKHFAANNQETDRMRVSAEVDARALREIYLRPFHRIVTRAKPWTVMAAYNQINGVPATEDRWLLTTVLREQWGFDGVVVSDWGAVADRVAAVTAGMDLTMPGGDDVGDRELLAAVRTDAAVAAAVAASADRIAALARRGARNRRPDTVVDTEAHHELAREAARRAIVLLRNDDFAPGSATLPLPAGEAVAVIGEFARTPRYQGGGSSHVPPTRLDIPLDEIAARAGGPVQFAAGYGGDGDPAALRAEAAGIAADAGAAVVFLGLDDAAESEGFDRTGIDLPPEQLDLLAAVLAVQPRTVVVLVHGGVLALRPVAAPAVLDAALGGQGGGAAVADVLYGLVNPSGKLAETAPRRLADAPSYLNFPGEAGQVRYGEGIFVGYRWYDARDLSVEFAFGHGLSYTSFEYRDLQVQPDGDGLVAAVTIVNTGARAGREVAQFYLAVPDSRVQRAPRQLVGFGSVQLEPGQQQRLQVRLDRDDLLYWDVRMGDWELEPGTYRIDVGASSRDIRAEVTVPVEGTPAAVPLRMSSTLAEVFADPDARQRLQTLLAQVMPAGVPDEAAGFGAVAAMAAGIPLDRLAGFSGGAITREQLRQVIEDR